MDVPSVITKKLPLLSIRARGEWQKDVIFQVIHGKQIVRTYSNYDSSAKSHLIKYQSKFAAAVRVWQGLSHPQKRWYTSRAAKLGKQMLGFNYFIQLYMLGKGGLDMGYPDPHHLSHEKNGLDVILLKNLDGAVEYIDGPLSPMILSGADLSAGSVGGTFKIAGLTALLRETATPDGRLLPVVLATQDDQVLALANITYLIILNYSDGDPSITTSETEPNGTQNIPCGLVMKDSLDAIHVLETGYRFQGGIRALHRRAESLRGVELESGSRIGYSGTNNFTMTGGVAFAGINEIVLTAYNSAVVIFTPVYQDSPSG